MENLLRFWQKVKLTANNQKCWEWTGYKVDGYGATTYKAKHILTHHLAWLLTYGQKASYILHSCDNRACCNPLHLREGTHKENMEDMANKNRAAKGVCNGRAKLTEAQVLEIRDSLRIGISKYSLAKKFGVSRGLILFIGCRRIWKHI